MPTQVQVSKASTHDQTIRSFFGRVKSKWRRTTCSTANSSPIEKIHKPFLRAHVSLIFATCIILFQLANRPNPRWRPSRSKPNKLRWSTIASPRNASNSRFVPLSFIDSLSLSLWSRIHIKVDHAPVHPLSYAVRTVLHMV